MNNLITVQVDKGCRIALFSCLELISGYTKENSRCKFYFNELDNFKKFEKILEAYKIEYKVVSR